jgi:hypothetical protein
VVGTERPSPAASPELPANSWVIPPEVRYGVEDQVPADVVSRCAADGWTPLWRASSHGAEIAVFGSSGKVRFCETTPATVTLSPPAEIGERVMVTFRTAVGTVAGVTGGDARSLRLAPAETGVGEVSAYVRDGVFVAPNALPSSTTTVRVDGGDYLALPSASAAHTDRPQPNGQLDVRTEACLHNASAPPVVDAGSWHAGATATSRSGDQVHTARYGTLLASCVLNDSGITTVVVDSAHRRPGEVEPNELLYTSTVFVGFEWSAGASRSDTVAVTGLALDERVAHVELHRPHSAPVRADMVGGTFVLRDIGLNEVSPAEQARSTLTAYDADGRELATLSMPI